MSKFKTFITIPNSDIDENSPLKEEVTKALRDNLQRYEEILEKSPYIILQSNGAHNSYRGAQDFIIHGSDWELESEHHIWIPNVYKFIKLYSIIKMGSQTNSSEHFVKIKLNEDASQEEIASGGANQWKGFNSIILTQTNKGPVDEKGRWNKLQVWTKNIGIASNNITCGSLIIWLATSRTEYAGLFFGG